MRLLTKFLIAFAVVGMSQIATADVVSKIKARTHTEQQLPADIKALIGLKIPDMESGGKGGIPSWSLKGGSLVGKQQFGVEQWYRGGEFIFLVRRLDDAGRIVLDARVLPRHLLAYHEKNGDLVFEQRSSKYSFESMCYRLKDELVVGLMRPERGKEDCTHTTKRLKRAWKIDAQNGRISDIPTQGVSCSFMDAEYSCDSE